MSREFVRTGELMDLHSYPQWVQAVVQECKPLKLSVAKHPLFLQMRDGRLSREAARRFLIGVWPVIKEFPQCMAMTLLKVRFGEGRGHDMAHSYLTQNIRVEKNHVHFWVKWAAAHGVDLHSLLHGERSAAAEALSHWCWHSCERGELAEAIAATNYSIEGVTGEWSSLVCSSDEYASGFAPDVRKEAMKWLRVHAAYDDTHPWEALDIIATLLGNMPDPQAVAGVRTRIQRSYEYMVLTLEACLAGPRSEVVYRADAA